MTAQDAEIVIVGAGIAGCAAAITLARSNKKVLIVEKSDNIGGTATNSNVGTICGAYYRTFSQKPIPVGYNFSKDFISGLIKYSGNKNPFHYHNGLFVLPFDWFELQKYLERLLLDNQIRILLSSEITKVKIENKKISGVSIKNEKEELEIHPKNIIDCSGNGIISQLANLEMITSENYQSASQIFRVKNIISDNEYSLNMALKKTMVHLINERQWPQSFKSISIIPGSLKNNEADFKITLPEKITDNSVNNFEIAKKAKSYVKEIFPPLTQLVESLNNASIKTFFPQLGIRIQQRSKGKYILTKKDVLTCRKFNNGIALGAWPIEEWHNDGKISMEYFEPEDAYMIPADCLMSNEIDNLFFAGKNISATTKAIASARVIGTCLQTGYAAGKIASCLTDESRSEMIIQLNKELLNYV